MNTTSLRRRLPSGRRGRGLGLRVLMIVGAVILSRPTAATHCYHSWTLTLRGVSQVGWGDSSSDSGLAGESEDTTTEALTWPPTLDWSGDSLDGPSVSGGDIWMHIRRTSRSSRVAEEGDPP